jgi:Kelch motif.
VELVDQTHTRGVVTMMDGDGYVTLHPGESERLVKTLHINDTVPVTILAWLFPDGLPDEMRVVSFAPPMFAKDGPAVAYTDEIISYTLTLDTHDPLVGALRLTDTLPAGVEYAGGLNVSYGDAWYDGGDGAIYWSNTPASALTRLGARSETGPSAELLPTPYPLPPTLAAPSATWFPAAPLPRRTARYAHAQCPGEPNRFYIIAGVSDSTLTNRVWRYDADVDTWTELAPIPQASEGPSAVCYRGYIYVAGGGWSTQFYIYDIARDTWSEGPTLPRQVWGAAFGAWDGRLFLAGGDNDFSVGGASTETDIYDIAAGVWYTNGATMPAAATAPGWVQVNEYLYIVGGWGQ